MELIAKSDVGKKRLNNEDSYYIKMLPNDGGLFIVADGLGGYSGGEIASDMLTKNVLFTKLMLSALRTDIICPS